jgi:hypothetical protein
VVSRAMGHIVSRYLPCMKESFGTCLHCQHHQDTAGLSYLKHVSQPTTYEFDVDRRVERVYAKYSSRSVCKLMLLGYHRRVGCSNYIQLYGRSNNRLHLGISCSVTGYSLHKSTGFGTRRRCSFSHTSRPRNT